MDIVRGSTSSGDWVLSKFRRAQEQKSSECFAHLIVCVIVCFIHARSRSPARVWQVEMLCGFGRLFESYADPLSRGNMAYGRVARSLTGAGSMYIADL